MLYTVETSIPKYPFEPDSKTGNKFFRINRIDAAVSYVPEEFLTPHRKDYYFFAFVKQGRSRHWIDMQPYVLKENTFYFTVPYQVHMKEAAHPMTGIVFSFTREFLLTDGNDFLKNLPIIQNTYNGHELQLDEKDLAFVEDILEKVYAEYHTTNEWQQTMLVSYVKVLLIYLSRLYTAQFSGTDSAPNRQVLKKYLSHIESAYTHMHEVAAYAQLMNISAGHLSEVVKEQSGKPAIVHIHERIMLEARRLLFHTDQSIKEVAFNLGFEDAAYFNRFFKRLAGQTPVQYRTTIREIYH